jgi:hypothetical protein
MLAHYKAFLIVLMVSVLSFRLARPAFTQFMTEDVFVRRRNLWLSVTSCAFLIPNFWIYMVAAGVLIWRAQRRDPNPAALYLFMLLVIPPFQATIPGFGLVNQLFPLDHFRLLSLALIVPAARQLRAASVAAKRLQPGANAWLVPDILLLIYGALQILLYAPYMSMTDSLRSTFLLLLDVLLPYYVLSRFCTTKNNIVEALAGFALGAVILVPLAVFETGKGWLLYSSIADNWKLDSSGVGYLLRGDVLRAQVTSGQSIVLGNFYAVALGLWMYLQSDRLQGYHRWLGTAAVVLGLLAAFSRGPWVGAALCVFVYYAVGPNAGKNLMKLIGVSVLGGGALLASPLGGTIIDHLPFIGSVDEGNVTYRQEVIDRSWMVIQQNPFFGSPYFINQMEDLRTGQGIIDLLNVYLNIGMAYGLVTLGVFIIFLIWVAGRCLKKTLANHVVDPDSSRLGAALLAAFVGTLLIIYTVSNYLSIPYIYLSLAALMVAYSKLPTAARRGANNFQSFAQPRQY